jgi:hypothetical protein
MALRDVTKSIEELDRMRLQERYRGADLHQIGEAPLRTPIRIAGEVQRHRLVPRQGTPVLEVTVSDGTGTAVAVFSGRKHIAGLDHGRGLVLEGVARDDRGRRVMLNPVYTLLP